MKKKVIVSLLILIVAIMCCACGPETKQKTINNNSSYEQEYDDYINDLSLIVYVTPYGKRYHQPGCGYVKKVYKKLTVKQAKNSGYTPCQRCCY